MNGKKLFVEIFIIFLLLVLCLSVGAEDFPEPVTKAKNSIKGDAILADIDFLASEFCRGRETGEKGMDVASKFLTTLLSSSGITPAGDFGSYFQYVPLRRVTLGDPLLLDIEDQSAGGKSLVHAKLEKDFLPISLSAECEVKGALVFAGYGITAPEYNYDDYRQIDVRGKIVLLLRHEPKENVDGDLFEGRRNSKHGTLLTKILNAQKHGALGVLIVNDPLNHRDPNSYMNVSMGGTYWPQLQAEKRKDDEDYRFFKFSDSVRIEGADFGVRIPAAGISGRLADFLLCDEGSLLSLQKRIDESLKPASKNIPGKMVSLSVSFSYKPMNAHNIIGKIEGSDPSLKNEVVMIGAHYDHLGKDNRGRVYGGADDNASGTAAVVEIARAFQAMNVKPKRTLVFVLFCGEEMGLLGSRYYVEQPVFPLEKTVAMINLDMIGRNDIEQLNVLGKYQYPKLFAIIDDVNKNSVNFDFNFTVEDSIRGSDHYPFMRKDVPSVFFITGMHDQYHRPEDTVDRILPEKVEKVAQLAFLAMWKAAELPAGSVLK